MEILAFFISLIATLAVLLLCIWVKVLQREIERLDRNQSELTKYINHIVPQITGAIDSLDEANEPQQFSSRVMEVLKNRAVGFTESLFR